MPRKYVKKGGRVQVGRMAEPSRIMAGGEYDPVEVTFNLRRLSCRMAGRLMLCGMCQATLVECKRETCKAETTEVRGCGI